MSESIQTVEPADSRITFVKKNELVRTLKKIDKHVDAAIDFLSGVMADDKNELKVRVDAAKFIIDKKQSMAESIAKDQLSRCVAESRLMLAQSAVAQSKMKNIVDQEEDEESSRPLFLADVIIDHSKIGNM